MDVRRFCEQSNVVVIIGKGGVGKTTVATTLALTAAAAGLDVMVCALDDATQLSALFELNEPVGYDPHVVVPGRRSALNETGDGSAATARVPGRIRARTITANDALTEYLEGHGLTRVARRLLTGGVLDVVATAIPGVREVLVLGKLRQIEESGIADLVILDAPASGHAYSFLTSPRGLVDTARSGPLRTQAESVVALLGDPSRCQVLLVTIPEETPVNEAVETAYRVEDDLGVALGPVVVNCCYPLLDGIDEDPELAAARVGHAPLTDAERGNLARAAHFRRARQDLQIEELERLGAELPLAQLRLPLVFSSSLGSSELDALASALSAGISALP